MLEKDEKPKKATKSKQITRKKVTSITGLQISENWCRKCMKMLPVSKFYSCTTPELDSSGFLSICKDCINEMYLKHYDVEKSVDKTILKLCRLLNTKYDMNAVESTKAQINTYAEKGQEFSNVFGVYKGKLYQTQSSEIGKREVEDLSFHEPVRTAITDDNSIDNSDEDAEFVIYLKRFWGEGLTYDQYEFLESELDRYKKTHKCDTATEESLLRQICFAELDIRENRTSSVSPDSAITRLQQLMKTASVDPAKAALAGSGKSQETFSGIISIIEQNEPADYYKDKKLFQNFDNIDWYFKKYVTRPLKNFITQSRDFNVEQDDDEGEDEFDNIIASNEDGE
jgi:hypothetical protein